MECRYEDLCTAPEQTMAHLAKFLNRTESDAAAALAQHSTDGSMSATGFENVANVAHHMRLKEHVSPSRVGRYKSELVPQLRFRRLKRLLNTECWRTATSHQGGTSIRWFGKIEFGS